MLPIFNEYRGMLKSFGVDLSNYDEDKLWIDRLIIRGIDKQGKNRKICRLKVTDDLLYEYKFYDKLPKNEDLMNWEESYKFHEKDILAKEKESVDVIKQMVAKYIEYQIVLTTSMGKDSKLTEYLLRKITNNYKAVFHNTTLDCADVYSEVKSRKDVEIITPKLPDGTNRSFYKMIKTIGVPRRTYRWCCNYFKENASKEYFNPKDKLMFVMGMRNDESKTRSEYGWERKDDRESSNWIQILPIRKWEELELWLYTIHNNIPINPKYFKGYSRVGCNIACPYYTKSTWVLDKYWFPKGFERFHKIIDEQFERENQCTINNCTRAEYHMMWNNGSQVRSEPTEEVIKEFMEYKGLTDENVARQYFNKTCEDCGKKVYKKDEVAMNLKYFGRTINKFKCKKCLMKDFGWSKADWNKQVEDFKAEGCKLF